MYPCINIISPYMLPQNSTLYDIYQFTFDNLYPPDR